MKIATPDFYDLLKGHIMIESMIRAGQTAHLDTEAIKAFENDKDIEAIQKIMDEMEQLYIRGKLPQNMKVMEDRVTKELLTKAGNILTERVGITYKFYGTNYGAHCIVTPAPQSNIVNVTGAKTYEFLKLAFDEYNIKAENKIDKVTRSNQTEAIYSSVHKGMVELEKALFTGNFRVDYKNMKIHGLSKDVVSFIGIPFRTYFKHKMTARQIMAIILHEVGHSFNMISTMHQMATTVMTTADALVNNKPNEKEVVDLAENFYNRKFKNANDLFYQLFTDDTVMYNDNKYLIKNNESTADQFSTRFGYGKELVTALAMFYNIDTENKESTVIGDFKQFFNFVIAMMKLYLFLLLTLVLVASILISIAALSPVIILVILLKVVYKMITNGSTISFLGSDKIADKLGLIEQHDYIGSYSSKSIYDDLKQRFKRVKLDIIRQMRTYDLSEDTVDDYLKQIKKIELLMTKISNDRGFFRLVSHLVLLESKDVGTAKFFMNIEEIMENDFHVRGREFKKLLQR
jgi:hypothetical protein